ncbi:LPS assembly protein LptD [Oceanisphaera pacifica]|uniref:LPS-assembly protein LptD n=1 Tax=Oceanisphaera pacifica TaxID=2818389 RepID=A0ABS3NCQ3_9GAMM|nr:LPS assembly protein LptD [Oceanisphaera pacifica]MBO1518040.1 LPS assembly protein LptD [Oceanisphaera pacifica]
MRIRIIGLPLLLMSGLSLAQTQETTAATQEAAFNFSRCFSHVPLKVESTSSPNSGTHSGNGSNAPITVTAKTLDATRDGKILYSGDVHVEQNQRKLSADYLELEQLSRDVLAEGNIHYTDGAITVDSQERLTGNLTSKDTQLDAANYQFHGEPGRGHAKQVRLSDNTSQVDLTGASYTTCPPNGEAWQLKASSVKVEQDEVFGEAWNAVLWLGDVPVFYFPYIKFPVKDERQSGLLYPSFEFGGDNGTDISLPYYWNIAPNYDATFTPRYMKKRGTMAQLEFRYLPIKGQSGTLYGEYLSSDDELDKTQWQDDPRWLFSWRHNARFDDAGHWRASANYTKVADWDKEYFDDFSPPVGQIVDDQLIQSFRGGYYDKQWQLTTEIRDYQILKPDLPTMPFQLAPSLALTSYQGFGDFDLGLDSEITQFKNDGDQVYEATRVHIEPKLVYSIVNQPGAQLTADMGAYYTHYEQDVPDTLSSYYQNNLGFSANELDSSVDRLLPRLRVNGTLVFDRETQWFEQDFTQTIEPQLQYLYVPFEDQDNIGLYDTTDMRQDYYSLFSDRRYAGLDRISDANQITAGFTSRIYDAESVERLRLAIAQTYNFVSPRVRLFPNDEPSDTKRSFLTFEGDLNVDGDWFIHTEAQQDTRNKRLAAANVTLEYNNQGNLAQLGFRHLNQTYFPDARLDDDLNQLGGTFSWPLDPQWRLIGGHYRDIELNRNIDTLIGLRYDSCCWAVSLVWEQSQKEQKQTNPGEVEQETLIGLRFELKGLSSLATGDGSFTPGTNLLPYYRPFNLNN